MLDCLIVGAGPAGAIAALVLARAGARVSLVDRAAFPRDKLCGDTVNPGTLALLRRLDLAGDVGDGIRRGCRAGRCGAASSMRYSWGTPSRPDASSSLTSP
ncbi:MAG: hypothetical protein DMF97_14040 [Acidobacteria bacterium]|nr:MAG: hypothetical protein DMF97_14040 [Acidobacteriota bacterium]